MEHAHLQHGAYALHAFGSSRNCCGHAFNKNGSIDVKTDGGQEVVEAANYVLAVGSNEHVLELHVA